MRAIRVSPILALGMFMLSREFAGPAVAQEAPQAGVPASGRFASLDELEASYRRQRHDLECRHIADLAALAGKVRGAEADAAYRQLFGLAITQGLCREAEAAAARCRSNDAAGRDVRALAALVRSLARADRGEHDRVLDDWNGMIRPDAHGREPDIDVDLTLAVGESLLQRLIRDGRYEVARNLCRMACEPGVPPLIRGHFEDRSARLDRLGKPAPAIVATDVDGKPVSLAEFKGRVVLVEFWATWCPPCVAAIPGLEELERKYHDRGLVILGINVDAMHEDVKDPKAAMSAVRRFLVRHRVTWTNVLNGEGAADFAKAYGVEEIPANFLVGRDGQIIAVEQSGEALERAVAGAVGDRAAEPGK